MKTFDLNNLVEQGFVVKPGTIAGVEVYLVGPKDFSVEWNENNIIYRSSMWTKDGHLISASYKKFFNFGEQPILSPVPESLKNCNIIEKIDGSLISAARYKNVPVIRTRGTLDAYQLETGSEIKFLIEKKYGHIFIDNLLLMNEDHSLIFEYTSPRMKIVIDYGPDPDLYLTGIIDHVGYTYLPQDEVDKYAIKWEVKRPPRYHFNDVTELLKSVEQWKGKEGVCLYSSKDQCIHKIKGSNYLVQHAFKSNCNIETIIDLFLEWNKPDYITFSKLIEEKFDHECMVMALGFVSKVSNAKEEIHQIIRHMELFVQPLKNIPRKEAASKVISAYGNTNRAGYCFQILDGKPIDDKGYKKLLFQVLKG